MGKNIFEKFLKFLLPVGFFLVTSFILFLPYFTKGLVSIPADILIGHYYPWKDQVWDGRTAGYPIKNFILFDGIRQTLPWRLLAIEQLKNGQLPLWNPYNFLGTPLLGNLQAAVLYPLNILFFILPELDAWTIYIFLQPVLASLFGYFFGRTLKISKIGCLLLGVCHGFSLIMLNHLEFGIDGHTALWLPLSLAAINKIQEKQQKRWGLVLSLTILMTLLGGYPPPAIYNLIIIFLYAIFKIHPLISKNFLIILVGLFLGFGLAAPQILPAFELSKKVVREETQFGISSSEPYFYPFENLIMIIAPDFFGHPSTNNFFSKINYTDNPSIGIIGFLFVIYSLFSLLDNKETFFWWIFSLGPILLMLETPLGRTLRFIKIPFFSQVTPLRMIWVISFSFSVLAGIGFDWLVIFFEKYKKFKFLEIFLPILFLFGVIFFSVTYAFLSQPGERFSISLRNLVLPIFFLLVSTFLVTLTMFFPKFKKATFLLIVLFAQFELLRQGIKYNPFIKKELVYPPVTIFENLEKEQNFRTLITHPELIPANANIPYKISMLDGYASIYDARAGQLIKLAPADENIEKIESYPRIVFQTEYKSRIIDFFGVKYVFSLEELKDDKLRLISTYGKTKLYENLKVFPRAFLVNKFWVEKGNLDIAKKLLKIDLREEVVLEEELNLDILKKPKVKEASIEEYKENKVLVKTFSDQPGILILTDSFDSGWQAFVDGKKTKILRADYNLRAVVVPKGEHKVLFLYHPESFVLGIKIFWLSLLLLIFWGFLNLVWKRYDKILV